MKRIFLFLALLLPMTLGAEDLRVAHIFSDHMVLQRGAGAIPARP